MPAPTALIFDLDGTLIDSVPDMTVALNRLMTTLGRRPLTDDELCAMVGDGATELVRRAFRLTGAELAADETTATVERYIDFYAEHPAARSACYPGVAETLDALAASGRRLALCTNKPERVMRPLLDSLGLADRFEVVLGAGVLPTRKPDPAPVRWVLDRLAVSPASAMMVGDSRNDILAAQAAGVRAVAVGYGYSKVPVANLGADVVIDRFEDLLALVEA